VTYIADLAESGPIKSVGYLAREHAFAQGEVSEEVFDRLVNMLKLHIKLYIQHWMGYHHCYLGPCGSNQPQPASYYQGLVIPRSCRSDIVVPDEGVLYVAPALVLHYIRCHHYLPPACFLEAVLKCPETGSDEWVAAVMRVWPPTVPFW
jgi:hypothetical protein